MTLKLPVSAQCFFFSSRRRHTRWTGDWSSDVCSSDLMLLHKRDAHAVAGWDPEEHPRSVLSGRTNDEVAADPHHVWRSEAPAAEAEVSLRSEERRVGKECRSRGAAAREKKKRGGRRGL